MGHPKSSHLSKKRKTTHRLDYSSDDGSCSQVDEVEDEEDGDVDASSDSELSAIQRQFASDIFQLAPFPKLAPSSPWILLDPAQRRHTKIDIFHSLDFSGIFSQIQYRVVFKDDWDNIIFKRYFPEKEAVTAKALQQFPSASYYRQWQALMDRLDEDTAKVTRDHLLTQWFKKLCWVPHPDSDRMWSTRKGNKEWIMLPPGEQRNCPRIAINSRFDDQGAKVVLIAETS
ncbi:hypothetical protein EDD22DRAFT_778777 [Suillus occidentalis]|nr:hypothetical protein EDD22DRAFT_778777 [Suillus occidentalis]